jgi:hypothetical protein
VLTISLRKYRAPRHVSFSITIAHWATYFTWNLCSFLRVTAQVSQPYKTIRKITTILILMFLKVEEAKTALEFNNNNNNNNDYLNLKFIVALVHVSSVVSSYLKV